MPLVRARAVLLLLFVLPLAGANNTCIQLPTSPHEPRGTALFESPQANPLAITPDGARVYVADTTSGTVSVIDASSNSVVETIPVGSQPASIWSGV